MLGEQTLHSFTHSFLHSADICCTTIRCQALVEVGNSRSEGQLLSWRQTYSIINTMSTGVTYEEFISSHLNKIYKKRKTLLLTIQILNIKLKWHFIHCRPLGKVSGGKPPSSFTGSKFIHLPDFKDCFRKAQLTF